MARPVVGPDVDATLTVMRAEAVVDTGVGPDAVADDDRVARVCALEPAGENVADGVLFYLRAYCSGSDA